MSGDDFAEDIFESDWDDYDDFDGSSADDMMRKLSHQSEAVNLQKKISTIGEDVRGLEKSFTRLVFFI